MKTRIVFLLLFAFMMSQAVVYAEKIEGQIANVNAMGNQFSVLKNASAQNPAGSEQLTISVLPDKTKFKGGINSLNELNAGQEVKVDARDNNGILEAESVELKGGSGAQPAATGAGSAGQPAGAGAAASRSY